MKVEIAGFDGIVPRTSPTMLGNAQAQVADNVKLWSREIRTWAGPTLVQSLPWSPKTIFKVENAPQPLWLAWANEVDVVPGPLADLSEGRAYYTGDGVPKKTNYAMATNGIGQAPNTWLNMGVPGPAAPPAVNIGTTPVPTQELALASNVAMDDNIDIRASQNLSSAAAGADDTVSVLATPSGGNTIWKLAIGSFVGNMEDGAVSNSPTEPVHVVVTAAGFSNSSDQGLTPDTNQSRYYVYTYISKFGAVYEESAPSPPSQLVTVAFGQAVTVSGFAPPPTQNYNIVAIRIYRTFTGNVSDGYAYVTEIPLSQTSYTDALLAAALGAELLTVGWIPPPANMQGLTVLSNGCLAGFVNNTIYFSVPYYPHAWPLAYAINVPYKVIGMAAIGTTVVVCTEKYPYIIDGSTPGAMQAQLIQLNEPCISKRSIASDEHGVIYASPNGLVNIGLYLRKVITESLYRRDEWQDVDAPSMRGVMFDGRYWGIYVDGDTTRKALVITRADAQAPGVIDVGAPLIGAWHVDVNATAVFLDNENSNLYFASAANNNIYLHDDDTTDVLSYKWRSKRFATAMGVTLSALKVDAAFDLLPALSYADALAAAQAYNANLFAGDLLGSVNAAAVDVFAVDGSLLISLPNQAAYRFLTVLLYQEQPPVLAASFVMTSLDPVRIPPFKTRNLEIELVGNIPVRSITLAPTVQELHE